MPKNVLVLGGEGMLGHRIARALELTSNRVTATSRGKQTSFDFRHFDATKSDILKLLDSSAEPIDLIVNAIGVIKPQINEDSESSRLNTLEVNAIFPHHLAVAASKRGVRVIQIATDCVFSGQRGNYDETSPHDAVDLYGQSKSMGEVDNPFVMHLRCSIVGTELTTKRSLWEWVRNQPNGATIRGFRNHLWNGVTTDAFGRICVGILKHDLHRPGVFHVVPKNQVSKAELVKAIAHKSGRTDIKIEIEDVYPPVNRTLVTNFAELNEKLWTSAGYDGAPNIEDLVSDYKL